MVTAVTVDDYLMGDHPKQLDLFMADIEIEFNIVKEMYLRKHLGINYESKCDDSGDMCAICTMEAKVDDIVKTYENFIGAEAKIYLFPNAPSSILDKNEGEVVNINMYCSLVGKIMFFVTKLGPKMCNSVQDLVRQMSNPGDQHWEELMAT